MQRTRSMVLAQQAEFDPAHGAPVIKPDTEGLLGLNTSGGGRVVETPVATNDIGRALVKVPNARPLGEGSQQIFQKLHIAIAPFLPT